MLLVVLAVAVVDIDGGGGGGWDCQWCALDNMVRGAYCCHCHRRCCRRWECHGGRGY